MMRYKLLKKTGFLLVVLFPCLAQATIVGTVTIEHTGFYAHESIIVTGGYRENMDVYAGAYQLNKTGGSGEGNIWSNGSIGAFCIELAEPYTNMSLLYDVIPPDEGPLPTTFLGSTMGKPKAEYLSELWGRYYDPSWVNSGTFTAKQNSEASIFAAAIWEIVHEDLTGNPFDWDVTVDGTGGYKGFQTTGVDSLIANSWLHSLDGTGPMADLRIFSYDGRQDFLVAVPEPATIALIGISGAFGLLRRKKRVS